MSGERPRLYFDLASPYAYLAVSRVADVLGEPVALEPILLGAIFGLRGSGSWAHTDARAAEMAEVEVRAAIADQAVKDALRASTEAAWADGVRAVPTLRLGDALYYGDDQLDRAAAAG